MKIAVNSHKNFVQILCKYSGRKQVNYRQAYACYRKDMNNEQRYCDDTAGVRSDDKGIE